MRSVERRLRLLEDLNIWETIELPTASVVKLLFSDITINSWCNAAGVHYEVNKSPDPEFHCETTVIFSLEPQVETLEDDGYDDDL